MAKEAAIPFQVRFAPKTLENLRNKAEENGSSVHAEIISRIEQSLVREYPDPEIRALRLIADSMIESFAWRASTPEEDYTGLTISLVWAGLSVLFDHLGAGRYEGWDSATVRGIGAQPADRIWAELQRQDDTPLGNAGRVLGVPKKGTKP